MFLGYGLNGRSNRRKPQVEGHRHAFLRFSQWPSANFAKIQAEHGECRLKQQKQFQMNTITVHPAGLSSQYNVQPRSHSCSSLRARLESFIQSPNVAGIIKLACANTVDDRISRLQKDATLTHEWTPHTSFLINMHRRRQLPSASTAKPSSSSASILSVDFGCWRRPLLVNKGFCQAGTQSSNAFDRCLTYCCS